MRIFVYGGSEFRFYLLGYVFFDVRVFREGCIVFREEVNLVVVFYNGVKIGVRELEGGKRIINIIF